MHHLDLQLFGEIFFKEIPFGQWNTPNYIYFDVLTDVHVSNSGKIDRKVNSYSENQFIV